MNGFIFDTSIWIWCNNVAYPRKHFPQVWDEFKKIHGMHYIEQVKKEIEVQDDDLKKWFKTAIGSMKKLDSADPQSIIDEYYTVPVDAIADPYLIATAKENELIIVSGESRSPDQIKKLKEKGPVSDPKIPNICDLEKIEHYTIAQFWGKNKIVFR